MADPTDTTGAAGTAAGTGTATTGAANAGTAGTGTGTAAAGTGATGTAAAGAAGDGSTGTGTTAAGTTGTASATPPLDTILSGLKTLASEAVSLSLPSLSLQLVLPLADTSKATLSLYLTPPATPSTSGTAPKGGCLDDVLGAVRTAVNDSATFGETMVVEEAYVCVTSLQRT